MANLLQTGATWLGTQLKSCAGRSITIRQGASLPATAVTASVAQHEYEVMDDTGLLTGVVMYDWTVAAADLGDLSVRSGAVITETLDGVESRYEVAPIGKRQAVERLDTSGILLLLHSKKVA